MDHEQPLPPKNPAFDRIDGLKHHFSYRCGPVEYSVYYQPKIPQSYTKYNPNTINPSNYRIVTSFKWMGDIDVRFKQTSLYGESVENYVIFDPYGKKVDMPIIEYSHPLPQVEYKKIPNEYLRGVGMDEFQRLEPLPLGTYILKFKPSEFLMVNGTPCLISTPDMKIEIIKD